MKIVFILYCVFDSRRKLRSYCQGAHKHDTSNNSPSFIFLLCCSFNLLDYPSDSQVDLERIYIVFSLSLSIWYIFSSFVGIEREKNVIRRLPRYEKTNVNERHIHGTYGDGDENKKLAPNPVSSSNDIGGGKNTCSGCFSTIEEPQ